MVILRRIYKKNKNLANMRVFSIPELIVFLNQYNSERCNTHIIIIIIALIERLKNTRQTMKYK